MSNRILKYLHEDYSNVQDFVEIDQTESIELDMLDTELENLENNQFVETSDANSIKRREKPLNIQADLNTETLDFRRKRILNRYSTKPPFTIRYLQQQLDFLLGENIALAERDAANYLLTVTTEVENAQLFKEMIFLINLVKPANTIYQQKVAIKDTISLEEHITRQDVNWNYALGGWELGNESFATMGQEEVVK